MVEGWLGQINKKVVAIIISKNGKGAVKVDKSSFEKEDYLQRYIYDNPESIPLYDIKEDIRLLVLAREFPTNSGPIDAIGIDQYGELYIIETKLYKNPDKRLVISQALDYGAALWKHSSDFNEFLGILDEHTQRIFNLRTNEKIKDFFGLSDEEVSNTIEKARINLNDGIFHFVVLMDKLDDRLKDLILYVNQNSQFDIYAVELEYYKHDTYEIIIPKIFGAEVKKDIKTISTSKKQWNWDLFKEKLSTVFGEDEVTAAEEILNWAKANNIDIEWSGSQRGGFFLCFYISNNKGFYPFAVSGDARLGWNAPHQGDKAPAPFDKLENRREILKRMSSIDGAIVDLNNVDGFNGLKLPLGILANKTARQKFFDTCVWIKETLGNE
jgi:hypothetical protein